MRLGQLPEGCVSEMPLVAALASEYRPLFQQVHFVLFAMCSHLELLMTIELLQFVQLL